MEQLQPTISELLQYDGVIEAARIQALAAINAAWIQGSMTLAAGLLAIFAGRYAYMGAKAQVEAQAAAEVAVVAP